MARYFKINNDSILQSNDFAPQKEYVTAAEYTTCTGKQYADIVGWRYSEITLTWGVLSKEELAILLNLDGSEFNFTFIDGSGTEVTEICIPTTQVQTATRFIDIYGNAVFKDINLGVKFIECHND